MTSNLENLRQTSLSSTPIDIQLSSSQENVLIACDSEIPPSLNEAGGKAYNLHKLGASNCLSVPPWFAVPCSIFKKFLLENEIFALIATLDYLCNDPENNDSLIPEASERVRGAIQRGLISPDSLRDIAKSYESLLDKTGQSARFAVRSSGVMEDAFSTSCAGLYHSFLNLQGETAICNAIKEVWASSFNLQVVKERIRMGLSQHQCLMGVIVQELIDACASGVASTVVLSNNYPGTQITANFGMGVSVVDGEVSTDSWVLHHSRSYILECFCGSKDIQIRLRNDMGLETLPVDEEARKTYCLSPDEIKEIGRCVSAIKKLYHCEVDVEFALDAARRLFILQARPLVAVKSETKVVDLKAIGDCKPLAQGNFSVPGVASGRLVFIPDLESLALGKIKLSPTDIAIAYVTTNTWSQHLASIGGLITCEGSPSSHPILICREKGIPCVIGMEEAAFKKVLELNGRMITLDGHNRLIYPEILATAPARLEDLMERFKPVQMRPWPLLQDLLPSLIHNKMVILDDGNYWRKTPTFPITGFQAEFNLHRFDFVGQLVSKPDVKIKACRLEGFVCSLMSPYEEYVSLFDGMGLEQARQFHLAQRACMNEYSQVSAQFRLDPSIWEKYNELSAKFRAYIWLGGALRSYAERKVDEIGIDLELPHFYLDECAHFLQSEMPELDSEMHQEIHTLAIEMQDEPQPLVENAASLQNSRPDLYQKIEDLAKKYRFEHQISLHSPINLQTVYERILNECAQIKSGHSLNTHKNTRKDRMFLPHSDLQEWLRISIENRILQCDAHHLDARSKAFVRPKLLELGTALEKQGILSDRNQIFEASRQKIAGYMHQIQEGENE